MISAYTSIKGTTAPYTAEEKSHSRASNDYLRAIGVTRISSLYHVAILIATYFQCRKIISLDGSLLQDNFYTDGSVILFRLMNLVNISGGILRVICFRVLGRFFTFDLAVQKDQKVIQSGPYAIVRHPSYSAMLLHQIGTSFSMGVYGPLIPTHWRKRSALIHTGLSIFALVSRCRSL